MSFFQKSCYLRLPKTGYLTSYLRVEVTRGDQKKKHAPGGYPSSKNLCFSPKPKNTIFDPKNTFLISKSYSEHVSNVERCRECVFEHQNTIWSQKMENLKKI